MAKLIPATKYGLGQIPVKSNGETLEEHTYNCLLAYKNFRKNNKNIFENLYKNLSIYSSSFQNISLGLIEDIIFFSIFLHDIGKATTEFYEDKFKNEKCKSYHPLYSLYFLDGIEKYGLGLKFRNEYINIIEGVIVSHHTLLHEELYSSQSEKEDPTFFEEIFYFLDNYPYYYTEITGKECPYKINFKDIFEKNKNKSLKEFLVCDGLCNGIIDVFNSFRGPSIKLADKKVMREIFSFVSGNLIRSDWIASGMKEYIHHSNRNELKKNLIEKMKDRALRKNIIKDITDFKLKTFQEKASNIEGNVLILVPTGEGKTEASLLWALNNLKNQYTRIIYTMPTQTTSNALYKRFIEYFGKNFVGLVHSSSPLVLEENWDIESDEIQKEIASMRVFSKPITISTLDSFIIPFLNVRKWTLSNIYFRNAVLIIDEIHSYDPKLLGTLKKVLEIFSSEYGNRVCIMSATIPDHLKNYLLRDLDFLKITQGNLFDYIPGKIKKEEKNIDEVIDNIVDDFNKRRKVIVVVNTVRDSIDLYDKLKNTGVFEVTDGYIGENETFNREANLILYHSQFIKRHRELKEEEILQKEKWNNKGLVLVATQVVEISLDIDFDSLYTELAPIEAVIQRLGRINRRKIKRDSVGYILTDLKIFDEEKNIRKYPYPMELLEITNSHLTSGKPKLRDLSKNMIDIYQEWLKNPQTKISFEKKFKEDGYPKIDNIIQQYCCYQIKFKNDIDENILKLLNLRDISENMVKISVIPKIVLDNDEPLNYWNTVDIYKWLYLEMKNKHMVILKDKEKYPILDCVNCYDYEKGFHLYLDNKQMNNLSII